MTIKGIDLAFGLLVLVFEGGALLALLLERLLEDFGFLAFEGKCTARISTFLRGCS